MASDSNQLKEIVLLFLKLGTTAFGGPAAHIAILEDEVVRRRRWLDSQEFLDLLGATNLIPGPNSTEMAIHIGFRRGGWAGLVAAGVSFILPATLISAGLAWVYVHFGQLPEAQGLLYGIKPAVLAVVLHALWRMGRSAFTTNLRRIAGIGALALLFFGVGELLVLLFVGVATSVFGFASAGRWTSKRFPKLCLLPGLPLAATAAASGIAPAGLWSLFLVFVKIGSVLFGSGYVLLAFLRADLVERLQWISESQLLDAVAAGQMTPGPLFTTATFLGYLVAGWSGAAVATTGIFLPAFAFVAVSGPLIPLLRKSLAAGAFLDGVNAASFALMAFVALQLSKAAMVDSFAVGITALSFVLLTCRWNSAWLVLGGGLVGGVIRLFLS